jgi:hypothetical protein
MKKKCSASDCGRPAAVKGLCSMHYMRLRRNGDPNEKKKSGPKAIEFSLEVERLVARLERGRSPRTVARFKRAMTLLHGLPASKAAPIANAWDDDMNASKMLRLVEDEALRALARGGKVDNRILQKCLHDPTYGKLRGDFLNHVARTLRAHMSHNDARARRD